MQLAMIGLGRMGGNMVQRLLQGGHELVVFDRSSEVVQQHVAIGATGAKDLADLCARLRRPARLMVAYALDPVEQIPAVEVVPGPLTDPECLDAVRNWLRRLGRIPVVLRKEIPGNATGRIVVAVWRECIRLVLDGVLEVRDVDALISSGLAARWTAAGPFQTAYLEAGDRATAQLSAVLRSVESRWEGDNGFHIPPAEHAHLIRLIQRAFDGEGDVLRGAREERLVELRRIVGY